MTPVEKQERSGEAGHMTPATGWALVFPDGSWCSTVYREREEALQARDQALRYGHSQSDMRIVEVGAVAPTEAHV